MYMLYHQQPGEFIQTMVGNKDPYSVKVYTRVFALDMTTALAVPFTADGRDTVEILCYQPPADGHLQAGGRGVLPFHTEYKAPPLQTMTCRLYSLKITWCRADITAFSGLTPSR